MPVVVAAAGAVLSIRRWARRRGASDRSTTTRSRACARFCIAQAHHKVRPPHTHRTHGSRRQMADIAKSPLPTHTARITRSAGAVRDRCAGVREAAADRLLLHAACKGHQGGGSVVRASPHVEIFAAINANVSDFGPVWSGDALCDGLACCTSRTNVVACGMLYPRRSRYVGMLITAIAAPQKIAIFPVSPPIRTSATLYCLKGNAQTMY